MEPKAVNAAITVTSFAEDLWGIFDAEAPRDYRAMEELARDYATDIDKIVESETPGAGYWTAAKWMTVGDVLFFYITKTAGKRVSKLLAHAREIFGPSSNVVDLLERTEHYTGLYSGTIVACTLVSGPAEHPDLQWRTRFKSRIYAEIENPHVFDHPLPLEEFSDLLKIRQSAITPLHGKDFEQIKRRLARHNRLPEFLANTHPGRSLAATSKDNWPSVSCAEDVRFLDESQLREYFLDYLLDSIKDNGSPRLEECEITGDGRSRGVVDYFVKIRGEWVPVEAKLNMMAEKDLPSQIARYVGADSFKPTRRSRTNQVFDGPDHRLCIVVDQSGVYLNRDGAYIGCSPGEPLFAREDISFAGVPGIRERIGQELGLSVVSAKEVAPHGSVYGS